MAAAVQLNVLHEQQIRLFNFFKQALNVQLSLRVVRQPALLELFEHDFLLAWQSSAVDFRQDLGLRNDGFSSQIHLEGQQWKGHLNDDVSRVNVALSYPHSVQRLSSLLIWLFVAAILLALLLL